MLGGDRVAINTKRFQNDMTTFHSRDDVLTLLIHLGYLAFDRELPTGYGFADIVYLPKKYSDKPAMIIKLKYDKSADGAIVQIKEKKYVQS